ncbi:MAG: TolC family protein [candidate division KSB1 bacterium]|nr:TolC family protein [candidate division KSB1 bacterium]MDZ7317649.1 TolC family protein [candidate division KSB1 bacterium]MDZ7341892.1 TolC family protein [candidate division KSB1 bacterium]
MRKILLLLLLCCLFIPAQAQVTLSDCVKIALANNPGFKINEAEANIAQEDAQQAKSARLPSLDFAASYRRQSTVPELTISPVQLPIGGTPISLFPGGGMSLGLRDNYDFKLTLTQPIFTGFKLHHRVKAASALAASRYLDNDRQRNELIFRVETAYAAVLKAQKLLQVATSAREQVAAHLKDVTNFVEHGLAKRDELLKVQVKFSEAELVVMQAENGVRLARVALENLMGQRLPETSKLDDMKAEETPAHDVGSSLELAFTERAELKALMQAQSASIAARKIAQGGRWPSVGAFGTLGYGKPGLNFIEKQWMDYWVVGIGAEWQLWNWGQTRSQIQQQQLKIDVLSEALRQAQNTITLEVTQACLQLEEAYQRRQMLQLIETQAQESYRVTENSYRQGQSSHTEFFDAQSELTRARLQNAQAEVDLALAQANWRRAVGVNYRAYD